MAGAVVRTARLLQRRLPDRILALGADAQEVVVLQGTAIEIWDLLERPTTAEAIAQQLATRYGAPLERVTADVTATLDRLVATGLAEGAPS